MVKKILFISIAVLILSLFESCTKCGHCAVSSVNSLGNNVVSESATVCGENDIKAEKINCSKFNPTSSKVYWVEDK